MNQSGGLEGVRNEGALASAIAQRSMTFDGVELYPSILEKAAALGYSIICNHPFMDGNKRTGHAVMELFLVQNGWETIAEVDDQEELSLMLAAGKLTRNQFISWLKKPCSKTTMIIVG